MKNGFYVKLLFTTCILIAVGLFSLYSQNLSIKPRVEEGVLDLSNWEFERDGIVELRGQWGFTEGITNELMHIETFKQFASVPGEMPIARNKGAGTYHLKVILPSDAKRSLAVDVEGVRMSNTLIVNGQKIHSEGQPANSREDYKARNIPYTSQFTTDGHELNISFQVANFDYYKTGIHLPIYLGTSDQISKRQMIQIIFEASVVMLAIITAFIFLVVYFSFNQEKGVLILGIYFLVWAVLMATTNQKLFLQVFPESPFITLVKIRDFAMYFAISLLIYYAKKLFPQTKKGWTMLYIIATIYFVYSLAILLIPYKFIGGAGDAILLPLFNATYLLLLISMLAKYRRGDVSVVNKRELEYFILFLIAEASIIYSTVIYYSNRIDNLWFSMISNIFASVYIVLMFIEGFKKTYLSMEHYAAKLEDENRLKDEFLFRTSHELKTPLHGIINLAQLSLDHVHKSELSAIEKNNRLIKATARRMATIVNDLVDFSLIQENKFRMEIREVDLLYCVHSVVEVLDYQAREKNIKFQIKVPNEARYAIVDEARFIQVIYNLVQNSLRHTKDGIITISSRVVQKQIRLTVEDTGTGIPESEHEQIFEAYEQGSNQLNSGGLGLGLAISKQLVLQMGGTLLLDWSEVGKGSKFSIYVDKAKSHQLISNYKIFERTIETSLEYQPLGTKETILIVDDEPLNRKVLRELLAYQGSTILEAENGAQVFQLLASSPLPDLILLDVMLEDMTGYEICRQIREKYSLIEIPILFITVNHSIRDISQAFLVGGNDFLTKPFEAEEVRARVDTLLKMKKLAASNDKLKNIELSRRKLLSNISHDLGTPMQSALGFVEMLASGQIKDNQQKYLDIVHNKLLFMTKLTNDLFDLVKIDENQITYDFKEIRIQDYYESIEKQFAHDFTKHNIHFVVEPLPPFENLQQAYLYIDEFRMNQVIQNLLQNAIKFTQPNGFIRVYATFLFKEEKMAIHVEDSGIGINADELPHVFTRFYKVDEARSTKNGGMGLGLSISKEIINTHSGEITVTSEVDKGSIFTITLPVRFIQHEQALQSEYATRDEQK